MIFTKEIFHEKNFDRKLVEHIGNRLENSQYTDALKVALIHLTEVIREKIGCNNLDGDKLITKAFSLNNPLIKVNNLATESDKNEQKGIMQILQGIYSAFRNPLNHSTVLINEGECIRKLIVIDTILSYININTIKMNTTQNALFDKVSNENLEYYLVRDIDTFTSKNLVLSNIWLYGISGVGKTNVALRYILNEKRKFYHSIYFASVSTIDEAFIFLFEELIDRIENEGKTIDFKESDPINRKIKKLFSFLSKNFETVTIHFDEIYDFKEKDFHKVFLFFLDVLKNNTYECNFSNFNIIVTTIINPLIFLDTLNRESDIEKIKELFSFKEILLWEDEDLKDLFNLIKTSLHTNIIIEDKISELKNKPRELKKLIRKEMIG